MNKCVYMNTPGVGERNVLQSKLFNIKRGGKSQAKQPLYIKSAIETFNKPNLFWIVKIQVYIICRLTITEPSWQSLSFVIREICVSTNRHGTNMLRNILASFPFQESSKSQYDSNWPMLVQFKKVFYLSKITLNSICLHHFGFKFLFTP